MACTTCNQMGVQTNTVCFLVFLLAAFVLHPCDGSVEELAFRGCRGAREKAASNKAADL